MADYIGLFEIVALRPGVDQYGLTQADLRVVSPIVRVPPNDSRSLARDNPVQLMRSAQSGSEVTVKITIPEDSGLTAGSKVVLFLTYAFDFGTWADVNGQGVFFQREMGWANRLRYAARVLTNDQLTKESVRGASIPQDGSVLCEPRVAPRASDAGSDQGDAGP